jgi:hypothetical protein
MDSRALAELEAAVRAALPPRAPSCQKARPVTVCAAVSKSRRGSVSTVVSVESRATERRSVHFGTVTHVDSSDWEWRRRGQQHPALKRALYRITNNRTDAALLSYGWAVWWHFVNLHRAHGVAVPAPAPCVADAAVGCATPARDSPQLPPPAEGIIDGCEQHIPVGPVDVEAHFGSLPPTPSQEAMVASIAAASRAFRKLSASTMPCAASAPTQPACESPMNSFDAAVLRIQCAVRRWQVR